MNWYCLKCDHEHSAHWANICIGCPCPETKPAEPPGEAFQQAARDLAAIDQEET